ncbi:hypothetical protein [Acutalibacter muris]|uniref:hypothetical protein n=1 Tax=Acutalibacter muris TaxID=1796620 RepID=UPI002729C443|nr:hypothetical protein [Acutalibacter muris]
MLRYVMDPGASPESIAELRRSVGWGGMEDLRPFYEKIGFYTMLCGQLETCPES